MRSLKIGVLKTFAFFFIVLTFFLFSPTASFAQAPCPLSSANPSVTICAPANGATVTSPVRVVAGTTDSRRVNLMQIYLDGVKVYQVKAESLDAQVPMAIGTRRLTVQARDRGANWFKQTINLNVVATSPAISVSVSPASASIATGVSQQFTAAVSGTTNTAVTWSATGGTISTNGLYTAPAAAGNYTVRATSVADTSKSASATVTVTAPPPVVAVSVSPTTASLQTGATQQFAASVTGSSNTGVTWTATGGTISAGGLYTAPATAGTYTVTATSVADNSKSASATVTVTAAPPAVAVTISPASASLQTGATKQFTASVTGSTNTAVTWSATGGTISTTGLYTAPAAVGNYTVRATSVADSTKSASAAVTVTQAPPTIAVSPTSVTFTSIPAATTSSQAIVVTNTGGSTLTVSQATISGSTVFSVSAPVFPLTLNAGQSGSVTLQFAPQAAGTFSGNLALLSNASNTLAAIPLSGTATAPSTMLLSASPTSISFGSVLVGNTLTRAVTLTNTGNSSVTVFSASATGAGFTVTGTTFPFNLAAGANLPVNVQFAPQSGGAATGTVSFTSNATNTPTNVGLSGTGTVAVAHSVDLAWSASKSTVSGYNIYRGTQSGGPYTRINSGLQAGTSYTDSSVQSGLNYFYVVTAVDSQGRESLNSNEVTAVIPTP